jgi:hypothetical protein
MDLSTMLSALRIGRQRVVDAIQALERLAEPPAAQLRLISRKGRRDRRNSKARSPRESAKSRCFNVGKGSSRRVQDCGILGRFLNAVSWSS